MQYSGISSTEKKIICLCMCCQDYRDDHGNWGSLPESLEKASVMISHGLCPSCIENVYQKQGLLLAYRT